MNSFAKAWMEASRNWRLVAFIGLFLGYSTQKGFLEVHHILNSFSWGSGGASLSDTTKKLNVFFKYAFCNINPPWLYITYAM